MQPLKGNSPREMQRSPLFESLNSNGRKWNPNPGDSAIPVTPLGLQQEALGLNHKKFARAVAWQAALNPAAHKYLFHHRSSVHRRYHFDALI